MGPPLYEPATSVEQATFSFQPQGGNPQGQNAPQVAFLPTVTINCRPVVFPYGLLGDHCYIIARRSQTDTRYIESGPSEGEPSYNKADEYTTIPPTNAAALITWRGSPKEVTLQILDCMRKEQAVANWNSADIVYNAFGPNSNTFVSWILHECNAPARPSPFARAVGWVEH
jgi:hypothetical protein